MKVLVNGATGLVGLSAIDAFQAAGHTVRASDRPGSNFAEVEKRGVEIVPADLGDAEALGKTVEGMEIVAHVAGLFNFAASYADLDKVNHQGTRNVCEAVLKHAPNLHRFVQIATVGVYGKPVRCPCQEDDPKNPRNNYEKTKYLGELAAFEYQTKHGLPVVSVRPTLVYGPRAKYGHAMFMTLMLITKDMGRPMLGFRSGPRTSHVHIEDVGRAISTVADKGELGRAYNLADPNPLDGTALMHALADPIGVELKEIIPHWQPVMDLTGLVLPALPDMPFHKFNDWLDNRWGQICEKHGLRHEFKASFDRDWFGYMIADSYYDVTRLKNLGFEWKWPNAIEGLKATVEWYKDQEWLP